MAGLSILSGFHGTFRQILHTLNLVPVPGIYFLGGIKWKQTERK